MQAAAHTSRHVADYDTRIGRLVIVGLVCWVLALVSPW